MTANFSETEERLIAKSKEFAKNILEPNASHWARGEQLGRDFFLQAAEYELCGLLAPAQTGGGGLGYHAFACVLEQLAAVCFASTFALVVHNNLVSNIARNGDEEHKKLLPAMLAGKKIGAFLLTEPNAGSDASAIVTTVQKVDGQGQLSGAKAWITNGSIADVLSIYIQTEPGAGAKGIANYLIDAESPGVTRTASYELAGAGAMNVCGFEFSQSPLNQKDLMIEAGRAFKVAMAGIDLARAVVAAMCCGMLKRSLQISVEYGKARQVFGQSVATHQYPQHLLADVSTDLEAARALTDKALRALERSGGATVAAAHAKKFATKIALQRIADCMQMMGANGALGEYPMSRHLACAKLAQYVDGTSEIQNVVLARELFKA